MERGPPKRLFCRSCGMPLEKPEDLGTNVDGSKNKDYCRYCFQNGKFTRSEITMEQMIDKLAVIIAKQMKIPVDRAKEKARIFLKLRRLQR